MSNMKTAYYQVGGHVFGVSGGEEFLALMENYEPFRCDNHSTFNIQHSPLSVGTPHQLADQGVLSRFIEREGIAFDRDSLTIRVTPTN